MSLVQWGRRLAVCVTMVGLLTTATLAQGPGGGGGRGGMMMGGRGGGGLFSLLRMDEVKKELKIKEDQTKSLEDLGKKIQDEIAKLDNPMSGGGANFRDMSDEERQAMMKKFTDFQAKQAEVFKKNEKALEDILDPDQFDRLLGLLVQRENYRSVISSDKVAAAIEATAKQKEELTKISNDSNAMGRGRGGPGAGGAPGGGGQPDFAAMREAMEKARKETDDKMAAVLTDVQKKKLEEMKGAKFEFPAFGGPGGGGPGGGRGAGGGRPGRNDN